MQRPMSGLARLGLSVARQSAARSLAHPRLPLLAPTARGLSTTFRALDLEDDIDQWPKAAINTIINICPQGEVMVVERLGKLHAIREAGWFIAIPLVDQIRYRMDMREKALSISPQSAITKDNVHVQVSGNLYCQFVDAEKAAYGSKNPLYAVKQLAQSSMRAAIGELELDQILHSRAHLNGLIRASLNEPASKWGVEIMRYEITEVLPDRVILEAMDKQAAAERDRRKKVLDAEGDKRSAELESEGIKIKLKNESEGEMIKITNEAEAAKTRTLLQAQAEAQAIELRASAQARAISLMAKTLAEAGAGDAAKLQIAREYIAMYADIGQKSNTMIFNDKPADVNALMAQAASVLVHGSTNESRVAEAQRRLQ